jgi:hypothetical protein
VYALDVDQLPLGLSTTGALLEFQATAQRLAKASILPDFALGRSNREQ